MKPMDLDNGISASNAKKTKLAALISVICLGTSLSVTAQEQNENNKSTETIIVTGERLGGTLAENTSSITLFTDEDDNGENRSYYDLLDRASNVLNAPSGVPHIRGIDGRGPGEGFLSYMTGATPRVNTTVDGVSESWTGEAFGKAGLWDTEQVEIYKGPQSTNQGRNSIGGAVVIKTKDPTFYTEGKFRAGYENEADKYHVAGMVSAPIIDDILAFRFAIEGTEGNTPITYNLPPSDRYPAGTQYPWDPSEFESHNLRGKLLLQPFGDEKFTAKLTVSSRNEEGQYTNLVTEKDKYENNDDSGTRRQDTDSWNVNIDVGYQFSEELALSALLSRRDYSTTFEAFPRTEWWGDVEEESLTSETRLSYNSLDGRFNGIVGLSHFSRDQDTRTDSMIRIDELKTTSLFFDSKVEFIPGFAILAGFRYEKDKLKRDFDHARFPIDFKATDENSIFLPKLGVTFDVTDDFNLGFTVRKGYNAGGVGYNEYKQEIFEYEEEEVLTFELSSRAALLDSQLVLNSNIFYNNYDGYQTVVDGDSGHRFDNYIDNIPEGITYGAEIEADYYLDSGLDLFAFVGLLKTEITKGPDGTMQDLKGKEFSYAPDLSAGLGFTQNFDNGVFLGARVNHVSEYFVDLENNKNQMAGDYTVLNLNGGYATDDFTIRAYVKNATDKAYVVRQKNDLYELGGPRTFGIMADVSF